jgi:predicted transposase/invertase (TIGR01784 family)
LREIQLIDKDTYEVFYEKLTFIYLEMPKFRKEEEELVTHFDKWMYVLKNLPKLHTRPVKLQEKVFDRLFTQAEIAKLTPEDMRTYEESLKTYRDNYSVLETAKREGKQEEGFEIAKRLKQKGVAIEIIAETTELTKEQIEKL